MASPRAAASPWLGLVQRYQGVLGLSLLLLVAFLVEPRFFSPENLANVLNQLAIPGTLALGMTFVILTRGIDLSVGSLFALLNCVAAAWSRDGTPLIWTSLYVLAIGMAVGALTGAIVSWTRLQAFVVTLAAMVSLRGVAYVYSKGAFISGVGDTFDPIQTSPLGLPLSAYVLLVATVIATVLLAKSRFGRQIYAIGGNEEASRLSGLPVHKTRIAAYTVNGLCVAMAALMFTAKTENGQYSAGIGYELDAIAGAVVGGASLMGGFGNALGTFVGSLFIVSIGVLMQLRGVDTQVGLGFKGIIILIAVYLQSLGRGRS
jgi:ribose transport system permease protein